MLSCWRTNRWYSWYERISGEIGGMGGLYRGIGGGIGGEIGGMVWVAQSVSLPRMALQWLVW